MSKSWINYKDWVCLRAWRDGTIRPFIFKHIPKWLQIIGVSKDYQMKVLDEPIYINDERSYNVQAESFTIYWLKIPLYKINYRYEKKI